MVRIPIWNAFGKRWKDDQIESLILIQRVDFSQSHAVSFIG